MLKPRLEKINYTYTILDIQREFSGVSRLRICGQKGNKRLPLENGSLYVGKHQMKKQNNETKDGILLQKPCTSDEIINSVRLQRTHKNNHKYSTATQQM